MEYYSALVTTMTPSTTTSRLPPTVTTITISASEGEKSMFTYIFILGKLILLQPQSRTLKYVDNDKDFFTLFSNS